MDSKKKRTEFELCLEKYGVDDLAKVFSVISSVAAEAGLRVASVRYDDRGSYIAFIGVDASGRPFCETEWFMKMTSPDECRAVFAARFLESRLRLPVLKCLLDAGLEGGISAAEFLLKAYATGDAAE